MKKIIFVLLIFLLADIGYSQKIGEKIERRFLINYEKQFRKAQFIGILKYDSKGRKVYGNDIYSKSEFLWKYDDSDNLIYSKYDDGKEEWYEFNENNDVVHVKRSDGYEGWYEYDDENRMILLKSNSGAYIKNEFKDNYQKWSILTESDNQTIESFFDEKGNIVHQIDTFVDNEDNQTIEESWYEYDLNGNEIKFSNNKGEESFSKYDRLGKIISKNEKRLVDNILSYITTDYEYNSDGKLVHKKRSDGYEDWYEYYEDGKKKSYKTTDGIIELYNSTGNRIYYKNSNGYECWMEYDSKGNMIYEKTNIGREAYYEFDYYPNGKIRCRREYCLL